MIKHAIQSTVFSALSRIRSPPQAEELAAKLDTAGVPYTLDPCRACADPCDLGHEEWPNRFDVDMSSDMLGSVKPYGRQVVISTGKADWPREVTEVSGSLAEHLSNAHSKLAPSSPRPANGGSAPPGVFASTESNRLSILNGSHREIGTAHTVLVFPDYKLVKEVPATAGGATDFWNAAIDPAVGAEGKIVQGIMKSWVLPYAAVILLCSHKKRDNRCHIAAPILENSFCTSLGSLGWDVHTQIDDPAEYGHPALEDLPEPRADTVLKQLREIRKPDGEYSQRALILRNSHIGGHKFAGNVIIYFPTGNGVWYGRVSPHEVQSVVESTIIGGKVLPPLLRGGTFKRDGHSLMDW